VGDLDKSNNNYSQNSKIIKNVNKISNSVTKQDQIFDFDNVDPNEQNQNNFDASEINM
jgi:hypothetical protein